MIDNSGPVSGGSGGNGRNGSRRRNLVLLGLAAILILTVLFAFDFHIARFSDGTGMGTTKITAGTEGLDPNFRPAPRWFVVLEGPGFFKRIARRGLPARLSGISGVEADIEFLSALPEERVDGNVLRIKFSGKSLWLLFYSNYKDQVEWAYSMDGSTDWMADPTDAIVLDASSRPVLDLHGTVENEGNGFGVITYRANQRHRVSLLWSKIADAIGHSCNELRSKDVLTK